MWYRAKEAVEKLTGMYILVSFHFIHCKFTCTLYLRNLVENLKVASRAVIQDREYSDNADIKKFR